MKIIPTFLKRNIIMHKIAARQEYRDKLVTISSNLPSQDLQVLRNSESALKTFAHKNKIGLNITKRVAFEKTSTIEIFNLARYESIYKPQKGATVFKRYDGLIPLTTIIGDIKDKTDLLKTLKTVLKSVEDKRVRKAKSIKNFVKIIDWHNTTPAG